MHRALIDDVRERHSPRALFTLWSAARSETTSERFGREVALRWEKAADEILEHLVGLEHPTLALRSGHSEPIGEARARGARTPAAESPFVAAGSADAAFGARETDVPARVRSALSIPETSPRSRGRDERAGLAAASSDTASMSGTGSVTDSSRDPRGASMEAPRTSADADDRDSVDADSLASPHRHGSKRNDLAPTPPAESTEPPASPLAVPRRRGHAAHDGEVVETPLHEPTRLEAGDTSGLRRRTRLRSAPLEQPPRGFEPVGSARGSAGLAFRARSPRVAPDVAPDDGGEPPRRGLPRLDGADADPATLARLESLTTERERRAASLREWRRTEF